MEIVVVRYNAGNIRSVTYALERIGVHATVTDDPERIQHADKVIFPGVGEASSAMKYLRERNLDAIIQDLKQPVLGICLGMQLLCRHSEENDTACLGVFDAMVKKFEPLDHSCKVPQIGWNTLTNLKGDLFTGVDEGTACYFVHSYYATLCEDTIAVSDHIHPYSAALQRDNFLGVQFHPEKSAKAGETILKNFIEL